MIEIIIAVGATGAAGSGIASLALWQIGPGVIAWSVLSGIALVLSTVKPFLNLPARIERCAKLYGEYASLFASLHALEQDFHRNDAITSDQVQTFDQLRQRSRELTALDPPDLDRALIARLQEEVNSEVPPSSLWMPRQKPGHRRPSLTHSAKCRSLKPLQPSMLRPKQQPTSGATQR